MSPPQPKKKDVLLFNEIKGLDAGKVVNTFRVGKKWSTKVRRGEIIELAATAEEKVFGEAEVTDVVVGKWAGLKALAVDNHLWTGSLPQAAEEGLLSGLRAIYPGFDPTKDEITVLYIRRK